MPDALSRAHAAAHDGRMSLSLAAISEPRRLTCARCGAAFACGAQSGKCWCAEEDFRLAVPAADSGEDCLCPECLRRAAAIHRSDSLPLKGGGLGWGSRKS